MWEREKEFQDLLKRCVKKPSNTAMDKLVDIAVSDEKWVGNPSRDTVLDPSRPLVCEIGINLTLC
jgi:hypothetical protein